MNRIERITFNSNVMGGKPCIRGMRVTVGMILGQLAAKRTRQEILSDFPYLEDEDISAALDYAAWRAQEIEVPTPRNLANAP